MMNWTDKLTKGITLFWLLLAEPGKAPEHLRLLFTARSLLSERLRYQHYHRWLTGLGIRTVIDVGAHIGQFAYAMRDILPEAQIYSFEPLPDCFARLQANLSRHGRFQAFNAALGEKHGEVTLWRSSQSASSSVLPMADLHHRSFPETAQTSAVSVQMHRLDDFAAELTLTPKTLIKIDVQGYEDKVLRGAAELLAHVDVIMLEASFQILYEGQASFHDLYTLLRCAGFEYGGNLAPMLSPVDGTILQCDVIFTRKS